eukprot:6105445-Amphidinium_carterae.1
MGAALPTCMPRQPMLVRRMVLGSWAARAWLLCQCTSGCYTTPFWLKHCSPVGTREEHCLSTPGSGMSSGMLRVARSATTQLRPPPQSQQGGDDGRVYSAPRTFT